MPNRILKESICVSDSVDRLSWFEEVLFYRLIVNCDDYGRFDGRPAVIRGKLFPLKERLTIKDVTNALEKLADAGIVITYECEGKPYLYLPTWQVHQSVRAKKSRYPAPEDGHITSAHLCERMQASENICMHMQANVPVIQSNPNPNPNPNTNCASARERELTAEFETLWKSYPKKQGKDAALKAYIKAREAGTTLAEVETGLKSYVEYLKVCQTEEKYVKHGSTWFNQHCWNDTYVPTAPTSGKKDIPKGASGELGAAELEAIQQLLAAGKQEDETLPF